MKMESKFDDDMELSHEEHEESHEHHYAKDGKDKNKNKKHKVMSMEDIANSFSDDLTEEIEDCKRYFHMAMVAEKCGNHGDSHYLFEMSKDEFTHAYFIHSFMIEHDICITEEQEKDFECLKTKMKEFFR